MIRVAIVDDHPALRAGLRTVLLLEPGFVFAGENDGDEDLWRMLERSRANVVVLDYHLPGSDGLQLCREIKQRRPELKVLLYSAYASPALALPALAAGADGLLGKGAEARELFEALRRVYRGDRTIPAPPRALLEEVHRRLQPGDTALLSLLLEGCDDREVAQALQLDARTVDQSIRRLLSQLRVEVPATP